MPWSLRTQILCLFAGLIVVTVLGLTALHAWFTAQRVSAEIGGKVDQVAQTLSSSTFPWSPAVLSQMHGLSGAQFAVVDPNEHILASSADFTKLPPWSSVPRWQEQRPIWDSLVEVDGREMYAVALKRESMRSGSPERLLILYPAETYRAVLWSAIKPFMGWGAIVLLAAIMLSYGLARAISRPLDQVAAQLRQLGQGNYAPLALPEGTTELRDLVGALNETTSELSDLHQQIQKQERLSLLGQLSAGMAHSLRNDMTGARLAMQLLQDTCSPADQECLDRALRQLQFAEEHLQKFLTVGQPLHLAPRHVDLARLAQDVIDLLAPTAKHRQIGISAEIPDEQMFATVDANLIRQALLALLLNAFDAQGPAGSLGQPSDIAVQVRRDATRIMIAVSDHGPGLQPEIAAKLYEPFVTSKPEGIGLGLTATRQIVQAHGGELRHSREAGQTVFEILLPAVAESLADAEEILSAERR
jgi:signal transduction histidine kinase